MAIVSCELAFSGHEGGDSAEGVREYTSIYQVIASSAADDTPDVLAHPGLPTIFQAYPTDILAVATKRRAKRSSESRRKWEVTINYSSKTDQQQQQAENPLLRPPIRSFQFAQYSKPIRKDKDGKVMRNSAGDAFQTEVDDSRLVFVYQRNFATFDLAFAREYENAVNSDVWFGEAVRTVRVSGITANEAFENGFQFWTVSLQFNFRDETWDIELLDHGLRERLPGPPKKIRRIKDDDKRNTTVPWPLKASGQKYTTDEKEAADFVYPTLKFRRYKEKPFAALGI